MFRYPPQFCTLSHLSKLTYSDLKLYKSGLLHRPEIVPILPERIRVGDKVYFCMPGDTMHSMTKGSGSVNRLTAEIRDGRFMSFEWEVVEAKL